ncbi:MAG: hypothetical protein UHO61_02120 [Acutalibacteraceae bacterium]|nr:hypothetical protein [Acutalibacteraceae bacterium]
MKNEVLETEALPEASEKNKADETQETTPCSADEIFVPVKYNKEIRNLELGKAAELAQKGLKFEAIAADYENLKRIASENGKSVSEFLCALEEEKRKTRKKELLDECGGNEKMAEYVLSLEKSPEENLGLKELMTEFPDIKDISDLPQTVVENSKMKGTLLLDEYLRYLHSEKMNVQRAAAQSESNKALSIGSQTDRKGGTSPETAEFLKGLWR